MERSRRSNPSAKPRTSLLLLNVEIGNKNNQFAKFKFLVTIFHSNFWFTFQFRIWMMKVWYCVEQHFPKSIEVSKLLQLLGAAAACFHRKVSHAVVFVVVRGAAFEAQLLPASPILRSVRAWASTDEEGFLGILPRFFSSVVSFKTVKIEGTASFDKLSQMLVKR